MYYLCLKVSLIEVSFNQSFLNQQKWSCSVKSDSLRPHGLQPIRLLCPWDFPGKSTGVGCHFLLQCRKMKSESEVAQSCPTLCDPMDCSLSGSSVHGIFQAIVLKWIAISFSRGSSQPRDRTLVSRIVDRRFTIWATREVQWSIKVNHKYREHTTP